MEPIGPLNFNSRIRRCTFCACILGATLSAFVATNAEVDPGRWRVEFLGDKAFQAAPAATGDNWVFQATLADTGSTKVFKSGTERGWFIDVHAYGRYALVDTDVGSGARGFTIYDLEEDHKVVEFYTLFPHVSPDGRYLVYRKFMSRVDSFQPQVRVVDLDGTFDELEVDDVTAFLGIGDEVFPPLPPKDRPELARSYGTTVNSYGFEHVGWDVENGVFYFTAVDRTGHLNVVVLSLEPSPIVACYVPLTHSRLHGEYFAEKSVRLTGLTFRSPSTIVVTTTNGFAVTSEHRIPLFGACRDQNPEYAERVSHDSAEE